MKSEKNTYKAEFKSKIVMDLLGGEQPQDELAEKVQIALATLSSWHSHFKNMWPISFKKVPLTKKGC